MNPRAPRLRRTARAEEDLVEIWTYIARDNPRAADRLLDVLDEKSRMLALTPRLGAARDDIAKGVRHFSVGNYLILYRDIGGGVEGREVCARDAAPAKLIVKTNGHLH